MYRRTKGKVMFMRGNRCWREGTKIFSAVRVGVVSSILLKVEWRKGTLQGAPFERLGPAFDRFPMMQLFTWSLRLETTTLTRNIGLGMSNKFDFCVVEYCDEGSMFSRPDERGTQPIPQLSLLEHEDSPYLCREIRTSEVINKNRESRIDAIAYSYYPSKVILRVILVRQMLL
jgi:hypothetical protein